MAVDSRKLLKTVIKRIHPDLFGDQAQQREANTKALAVSVNPMTSMVAIYHIPVTAVGFDTGERSRSSKFSF